MLSNNFYTVEGLLTKYAPTIEVPEVLNLVVGLAASGTKHARIKYWQISKSAKLLVFLLNKTGYKIKLVRLYPDG